MDSKKKKKKKVQRIDVIPENAPYVEDSHITVGSFEDESLSAEDIEQEELSRLSTKHKRVGNDVDSNEPEMEKDEPVPEKCDNLYQRKSRKKTSFVWKYMDTIKDTNDVVKGSRCKICSQDFMKSDSSSTSSMKRHLAKCLKAHRQLLQPQLQFQRGPGDEVQLLAFKYDHAVMREKVSHYVMINELPFLHVESFMWNEIMRTATPFYEKITRGTLKADCRNQSGKQMAHLKGVLHDLYQEYAAEASRIKGITLESSQVSSSDNNIFMDDMETPAAKSFDVLSWWKGNSAKYPILSLMARDILAVPISTVASEASFSAGGRVIEPHRSCLKTEIVEMLLCGADWARALYGLKKPCQKKQIKPVEINLY
ncbi:hypothetical protein POM88_035130 [Heracleum sosnowskyi]|uniref:BED-type domain-containing protein n=1 Tax=Heracleum sosnowskyi TaxID=360622 RepID=A0AAD8HLK0_9APIA|nr:hypothetical protein POM88_035130 [Heracleum sosnowskyi]